METKRVSRRKHSAELRAQVVQACRQDGASVAAIALRNGLNANLVHRWLRQDGRCLDAGAGIAAAACGGAEFMPLQLPPPAVAATASTDIRIEVRRGTSTITVSWPLQGRRDCAAWLREWLR